MSKITASSLGRRFEEIDNKLVRRKVKIPAESRVEFHCKKHNTVHLVSKDQIINCNKN